MQIDRILYHSIQTSIKNVFLLNFVHELLMSFLILVKDNLAEKCEKLTEEDDYVDAPTIIKKI